MIEAFCLESLTSEKEGFSLAGMGILQFVLSMTALYLAVTCNRNNLGMQIIVGIIALMFPWLYLGWYLISTVFLGNSC